MRLKGKVAIVTGAGQGVGKGIAVALAKEGASVLVSGRTRSKVDEVVGELKGLGLTAAADTCDVLDHDQIKATVAHAVSEFGGVDIMVNNAYSGATGRNMLADADESLFIEGFHSGPLATLRFMQAVYPLMKQRGGGAIINLGSSSAVRWDMSSYGLYGAVKDAIRVLTRAAACEWGVDNIRVNVLCPLAMSPGLEIWAKSKPEEANAFFETLPQRRAGDCELDIGRAAVFLCTEDARYVSGMTMPLDGGQARFC